MRTHAKRWLAAKTCEVCGRPLNQHEGFAGQLCSHWQCRWTHLDNQLKEYRAVAAKALGEEAFEAYKPVVVPAWGRDVVPLPPGRKQTFRDRMAELAHEAGPRPDDAPPADGEPPSPEDSPDPAPGDPILSKVCAVCEGACCYDGRDLAFQDVETVGRFLFNRPCLAAEEAVSAYLSHLPRYAYEGSCVYHTYRGCVIPQAMRAPMCTAYECRGLKTFREHLFTTGRPQGFVVVRQDGRIVRGAFIDNSGLRHYPPRERSERRMGLALPEDAVVVDTETSP